MNESVNVLHIPQFCLISRYFVSNLADVSRIMQVLAIEYVGGILWDFECVLACFVGG